MFHIDYVDGNSIFAKDNLDTQDDIMEFQKELAKIKDEKEILDKI